MLFCNLILNVTPGDDSRDFSGWKLLLSSTPDRCPSPSMYAWLTFGDAGADGRVWLRIVHGEQDGVDAGVFLRAYLFKPGDVAEEGSDSTPPVFSCVGFGQIILPRLLIVDHGTPVRGGLCLSDSAGVDGSHFMFEWRAQAEFFDHIASGEPKDRILGRVIQRDASFEHWLSTHAPGSLRKLKYEDLVELKTIDWDDANSPGAIERHTLQGLTLERDLACGGHIVNFLRYSSPSGFYPALLKAASAPDTCLKMDTMSVPVWIQILRPYRGYDSSDDAFLLQAVRAGLAIRGVRRDHPSAKADVKTLLRAMEQEFIASPHTHTEVLAQTVAWFALNHFYKDDTTDDGTPTEEMSNPQIFHANGGMATDCEDVAAAMHDMAAGLFYRGVAMNESDGQSEAGSHPLVTALLRLASGYIPFTQDCVVSAESSARARRGSAPLAERGRFRSDPWARSGVQPKPVKRPGVLPVAAGAAARADALTDTPTRDAFLHHVLRLYPVWLLKEIVKGGEGAKKFHSFLDTLETDERLDVLHLESTDRCFGSQGSVEPLFEKLSLSEVAPGLDRYRYLMPLESRRADDFYDVLLRSYSAVAFLECGEPCWMGFEFNRNNTSGTVSIGWDAMPRRELTTHIADRCILMACQHPGPDEMKLALAYWYTRPEPLPLRLKNSQPRWPLPPRVVGESTFVFALAEPRWFADRAHRREREKPVGVACKMVTPEPRVTDSQTVAVLLVTDKATAAQT